MAKDLMPIPLGHLSWTAEGCEKSLTTVYDHVVRDAKEAIDWYARSRKPKKMRGIVTRLLALALVSLAGLLPIISELAKKPGVPFVSGGVEIPSLAASLAIGAAAALVGFDRFFGYSTGWMRYISTEMTLHAALQEFELEWNVMRSALRGQPPAPEQAAQLLECCKQFGAKVNTIVAEETSAWVQEFQNSLKQVDDAVKAAEQQARDREAAERVRAEERARAEAVVPGGLRVVLKNTAGVTLPWKVQVGSEAERECSGSTAAIGPLPKGQHLVKVFAVVGGEPREEALVATVQAGAVTTAEVTLD